MTDRDGLIDRDLDGAAPPRRAAVPVRGAPAVPAPRTRAPRAVTTGRARRPGLLLPAWTLAAGLTALLVLAPVAALGLEALQGSGGLWPHLLAHVLPPALHDTALLLAGVGVVVVVVGTASGSSRPISRRRRPGNS